MFDPKIDRLDYCKTLMPPDGFTVDFAIGTTYSLDLDALIGISIALGISETADSALAKNAIVLLDAILKISGKVAVFCNAGQIKVPVNSNKLHILLEKTVYQIALKNKKSFHPKLWLIRYINKEKEIRYRCIVLSRNMTFDRSWDIAVSLNNNPVSDVADKRSKPLSDFLTSLLKIGKDSHLPLEKQNRIKEIAKELHTISFKIDDKHFTDYSFFPVGIDNYDSAELFSSYKEMLIISPFLSKTTIEDFNRQALSNSEKNTLITRKSELNKLDLNSVSNYKLYVLKDQIIDGGETIEAETEEINNQDIHAKLYLKTKNHKSSLYIGSLNATESSRHGNIEFMLKLSAKRGRLNTEMLKKQIGVNEQHSPFEEVEIPGTASEEPGTETDLDSVIKDFCLMKIKAKITSNNGLYDINMVFDDYETACSVYIAPLLRQDRLLPFNKALSFRELNLFDLSEFFVIQVQFADNCMKKVIKIKTDDMPEGRESAVANSVIKSKEDFFLFISYSFSETYQQVLLENYGSSQKHQYYQKYFIPAIYEKLLKATVHNPQKFKEIGTMLDLFSDDEKIPNEFKELFSMFRKLSGKYAK